MTRTPPRPLRPLRPLAALVLAAAALTAQPLIPAASAQMANEDKVSREQWLLGTVSLDFPGGKVSQYVDALRKAAAPMAVNVSYSGNSAAVQLPAVAFRNVQIEAAIRTIGQLHEVGPDVKLVVREVEGDGRVGSPLFVVALETRSDRKDRDNRVLSLSGVLATQPDDGRLPPEVVLTAVETALRGDATGADIRFHKESGLLFVTGNPMQCKLAEEVVSRLRNDAIERNFKQRREVKDVFRLAHVDPARIIDAVRLVFPPDAATGEQVDVAPDPAQNSILVAAPDNLMVGVRALIRFIDRRTEDNPLVAELRAEQMQARRLAEMAQTDAMRIRDEAAKRAEEAMSIRSDLEVMKARAEEVARQREQAQKERQSVQAQLADAQSMADGFSRDRERLRLEIEQLQKQLNAAHQQLRQGPTQPK